MASRVCLVAMLAAVAGAIATSSAARNPPAGTAIYVIRHDLRLCPSPRCGGYWLALANGARTRCADGLRRPRCYVARTVDTKGAGVGDLAEGALARGAIAVGVDALDVLETSAVYVPVGSTRASGGFYRAVDTGVRCVRAPCFSFTVTQMNGSTRSPVSEIDILGAGLSEGHVTRAERALASKDGLHARGRFARTSDGGTVFRVLRLYLRAPLPRA